MICLIAGLSKEVTKNQKDYFKVEVIKKDTKDRVVLYLWDNLEAFEKAFGDTHFMDIEATWSDQFPKLVNFNQLASDAYEITDFVESYFKTLGEAQNVLRTMIETISIENKVFDQLNRDLFDDTYILKKFLTYPAAKTMHHAKPGGLLQHTFEVFDFCSSISKTFLGKDLNRAVILEGAFLHDIGKIDEYITDGISIQYSANLYAGSHLARGCEYISRYADNPFIPEMEHVKHIIMSHHFNKDWGAIQVPQSREALFVFYADYYSAFNERISGAEFDDNGLVKVSGATFIDFEKAFKEG